MPNVIILIPARLTSIRLPGKPLADLNGMPMIVHVLRRAESAQLGEVVVATDSEAVAAAVEKARGRAVMTRSDHVSGSDRIYEALEALDPDHRVDVVVNLQGDLPTINPADISAALTPLNDSQVDIATLAAVITDSAERTNPNVVKVSGQQIDPVRLQAKTFTRKTYGVWYQEMQELGFNYRMPEMSAALGTAALLVVVRIDYRKWRRWGRPALAIAIANMTYGCPIPWPSRAPF